MGPATSIPVFPLCPPPTQFFLLLPTTAFAFLPSKIGNLSYFISSHRPLRAPAGGQSQRYPMACTVRSSSNPMHTTHKLIHNSHTRVPPTHYVYTLSCTSTHPSLLPSSFARTLTLTHSLLSPSFIRPASKATYSSQTVVSGAQIVR